MGRMGDQDKAFVAFCRAMDDEAYMVMEKAKREYAAGEDRFANFNRLAAQLSRNPRLRKITPVDVACVYLQKHIDSIVCGISERESMDGRIIDAMNYLRLIAGMLSEMNDEPKRSETIAS